MSVRHYIENRPSAPTSTRDTMPPAADDEPPLPEVELSPVEEELFRRNGATLRAVRIVADRQVAQGVQITELVTLGQSLQRGQGELFEAIGKLAGDGARTQQEARGVRADLRSLVTVKRAAGGLLLGLTYKLIDVAPGLASAALDWLQAHR